MKKLILLPLFIASLASAEEIINSIDGDITLTDNTIADETLVINGAGTMTMGNYTFATKTVMSTTDVMNVKADYTFDGVFQIPYMGLTAYTDANIKIAKGKTLTIKKFDSSLNLAPDGQRACVVFYGDSTGNYSEFATVNLGLNDINTFNKSNKDEIWLKYANLNITTAATFRRVHVYFGSKITLQSENIRFEGTAINIRAPQTKTRTGPDNVACDACTAGYIDLNGYSTYISMLGANPSDKAAYVDFVVTFGDNTKAQVLDVGEVGWNPAGLESPDQFKLFIDDYDYIGGDRLYFGKESLLYQCVYVNGVLLTADMIEKQTAGSYKDKFMVIPEPSTYAMIFGAIALGFVAYRRRK